MEDAAKKVGVSKKSLDDYLLQLRFGKKYGFDSETNRNEKVGVLRSFVKTKNDELTWEAPWGVEKLTCHVAIQKGFTALKATRVPKAKPKPKAKA